jgi:hypothetical protein
MNSFALNAGFALAIAALLFACNDGYRAPRPTGDSSIGVDSAAGDSAVGDSAVTDSTVATDTSTPPSDSSVPGDASTTPPGQCEPSCLAMPGADCCFGCGACAEVSCTPVCPEGQRWDCELSCCFDTTTTSCVGD